MYCTTTSAQAAFFGDYYSQLCCCSEYSVVELLVLRNFYVTSEELFVRDLKNAFIFFIPTPMVVHSWVKI